MKAHWLTILILVLVIVGTGLTLSTQTSEAVQAQSTPPEELAKKTGCFQCHSVDKQVVGPAYKDVAARYKDKAGARAALIKTVRDGGKGHWTELTGGVPMPPHSARLSADEIARLVDWILAQ